VEPLISVIVPTYNGEKYIGRCMESILCQTYGNLEIIVVNDGSTDNTNTILSQYAAKYNNDDFQRIIIVNKKNGGIASARNKGLETAKGEYIGFVDHDDTIEKDMYETLVKNALKYNADISHCGTKTVYPEKTKIYCNNTGETFVQDNTQALNYLFKPGHGISTVWNKLYKAKLFENVKFNEDIKEGADDLLINYSLFSNANIIAFTDAAKYNWYQIAASVSYKSINIRGLGERRSVLINILKQIDPLQKEIYSIVFNLYIRYLFSVLKLKKSTLNDDCKAFQKEIKLELKKHMGAVIKANGLNLKYKIDCLGIFYIPFYLNMRYHGTHRKNKRKSNKTAAFT
jgi:glycosyltransferase involved in cell wall biosynthesis